MREISSVAVIGIGTMGRGICQLLATNGYRVSAVDVSDEVTKSGVESIAGTLSRLAEKGKLTHSEAREIMSNISAKQIRQLGDEDLAIECVSEVLPLKQQIFADLDARAKEDMIMATNTSSFTIREVFERLSPRRTAVGLHFFNPVHALPLVELVLPEHMPQERLDMLREFLAKNRRTVIEVRDSPGFIVNRVLFRMIAESCILSESQVATVNQIDSAMKAGAGLPLGPFELADLIGLDTCREILRNLGDRLDDDAFRRAGQYMSSLVEKGFLGRKSKRGFYDYGHARE